MGQLKKKSISSGSKSKVRETGSSQLAEKPKGAFSKKDFWKEEINGLAAEQFESVDAALVGLIDRALKRFPPQSEQIAATRSFLLDLLRTDPEIEVAIRKHFKIG